MPLARRRKRRDIFAVGEYPAVTSEKIAPRGRFFVLTILGQLVTFSVTYQTIFSIEMYLFKQNGNKKRENIFTNR